MASPNSVESTSSIDAEKRTKFLHDRNAGISATEQEVSKKRKGKQVVDSTQERATKIMKKLKRPTSNKSGCMALVIAEKGHELAQNVPVKRRAKKESFKSLKSQYPMIHTRSTTNILCELLKSITPEKKKCIHDMGFGELFKLNITELPPRICHWVLDHFDPISCSLKLGVKETEVRITPFEARMYIGLTLGTRRIRISRMSDGNSFVKTTTVQEKYNLPNNLIQLKFSRIRK